MSDTLLLNTLLLNASYEPLTAVPLPRAIGLVLAGKADVVTEGTGLVRSERMALAVPSVIRLRYYVKVPPRRVLALTKRNVLARDLYRCAYCGGDGRTVDHVIPRSRRGAHVWDNVVAACHPCNNAKGARLLSELGWTLRVTPRAPKAAKWHLGGPPDSAWEPFLTVT